MFDQFAIITKDWLKKKMGPVNAISLLPVHLGYILKVNGQEGVSGLKI